MCMYIYNANNVFSNTVAFEFPVTTLGKGKFVRFGIDLPFINRAPPSSCFALLLTQLLSQCLLLWDVLGCW